MKAALSTDMGRSNLFKLDIPTIGPPIAYKPYPNSLRYQKLINEEIQLLESESYILKSLSLWAAPVNVVSRIPDPLHPLVSTLILHIMGPR